MRLIPTLSALLILSVACRADSADAEREYAEVRKIALKDPKVQEAFDKAEDRLNAKILEIDPSLKGVVDEHNRAAQAVPAPRAAPFYSPAAAVKSAPGGRHYVVVSGDTLSSIAARFKVKVGSLEKANHITDARDLKIGQRLVIPQGDASEATPAPSVSVTAPAAPSPTPSGGTLLDRIKSDL